MNNDEVKGYSGDLLTFDQRAGRYQQYMANIDSRRFTTGLAEIDYHIRGVAPGEVMTIIAYSGTFKSAYLQNIIHQFATRTAMYQIMFSMEMPVEKVFEREMQIANQLSGREVERHFKALSPYVMDLCNKGKSNGGEHVIVCEKPRLTIEQIKKYVEVAQVKYSPLGCIGIDYLGLMKGDGKTIFERMAELSFGLKDMAKELQIPVILLGQVNRGYAASQDKEIEMDAAKGGGDIEAAADFMLGLFKHNDELYMKILKNRNGRNNINFKVTMDVECLRFQDATECELPKQDKGRKVVHI